MNDTDSPPTGAVKTRPCSICGKPQTERYRPFCSRRCADVDLGRWLKGSYAIPAAETDEEEIAEKPPEQHR
jgi:endogenous inhibitor of DNA gyrase (YacG/DUF329 family)